MDQSMPRFARLIGRALVWLVLFASCLVSASTATSGLHTVFSFATPSGYYPSQLVQASDGNFYGTTDEGASITGSYGTVFRLTSAGVLTTLHTFSRDFDGAYPAGALVQAADGYLYGVTAGGGSLDGTKPNTALGTVFRIGLDGTLTTLYAFSGGADGGAAGAGLTLGADGRLYGVTGSTIFVITTTGALTTLHTFNYNSDGTQPKAAMIQASDGNFYGTTPFGGPSNYGSAFSITPAGVFTTLHLFANADGGSPFSGLVEGGDGNFYGATSGSMSTPWGALFGMTPAGAVRVIHSFNNSDGAYPSGLLAAPDGNLYGATGSGGASGAGTVFRLGQDGTLSTLHSFDAGQISGAASGLLLAADGIFYATSGSPALGLEAAGSAFKISPDGTFSSLYSFAPPDGVIPASSLQPGDNGTLYGATSTGFNGTLFRVTPGAASPLTTLCHFDGTHGDMPKGQLLQGTDGNLYGTTRGGGAAKLGTAFKVTPAGVITMLHSFGGSDGQFPEGLVAGPDGSYYGVTSAGGTAGNGTMFNITAAGAFTTLHVFGTTEGSPNGGLTLGQDGNFYGSALPGAGGPSGLGLPASYGSLYRITPAGAVTVVHSFDANDINLPNGPLVQASDGTFYGTSQANGSGTVAFALTPAGQYTVLHQFTAAEGGAAGALIVASDGELYGTSYTGGTAPDPGTNTSGGQGTLFRMTPAGVVTPLHSFYAPGGTQATDEGAYPGAALVQGADGNFYGTTEYGGAGALGTVFEFDGPPLIPLAPIPVAGDGKASLAWRLGGGAVSYNVYEGKTPGGEGSTPVLTGITTDNATVTGLDNGNTYYFRITAVNAVGESLPSPEVSASPAGSSADGGGGGAVNPLALLGGVIAVWTRRRARCRDRRHLNLLLRAPPVGPNRTKCVRCWEAVGASGQRQKSSSSAIATF